MDYKIYIHVYSCSVIKVYKAVSLSLENQK